MSMCFNEAEKQRLMASIDTHDAMLKEHTTKFLLIKNSFRTSILILSVVMGLATIVGGGIYGFGAWYLGQQFVELRGTVRRSDQNELRIQTLAEDVSRHQGDREGHPDNTDRVDRIVIDIDRVEAAIRDLQSKL